MGIPFGIEALVGRLVHTAHLETVAVLDGIAGVVDAVDPVMVLLMAVLVLNIVVAVCVAEVYHGTFGPEKGEEDDCDSYWRRNQISKVFMATLLSIDLVLKFSFD